jgi:hypothetical protein
MANRLGELVWRTDKVSAGGQMPAAVRDRLARTAKRLEEEQGLGPVSVDELRSALLAYGITRSSQELADIVKEYRALREGQLDPAE